MLQIERQVAAAARRLGSAELVQPASLELPPSPGSAAEALAAALVGLARGKPADARAAAGSGLAAAGTAERDLDLRSRLARVVVDTDGLSNPISGESERLLGDLPEARLALDAARGQCEDVRRQATSHALDRIAPAPEALVLRSRAFVRCGRAADALAVLTLGSEGAHGETAEDPRIALAVGEALLALHDADSAARQCRAAERLADGVPFLLQQTRRCIAQADAARGVLPRARRDWLEAARATMLEPGAPRDARVRAGLAATWTLLGRGEVIELGEALAILDQLDVLTTLDTDRLAANCLRVIALAGLGREVDARTLFSKLPFPGVPPPVVPLANIGPVLHVLHKIAEGRLARAASDSLAASACASDAVTLAQQAQSPELIAFAELDRASLASHGSAGEAQRLHAALAALRAWPAAGALGSATPYADPALPRRAVEVGLGMPWGGRQARAGQSPPLPEEEAGARLAAAESLRLALGGRFLDKNTALPGIDDLQRHLATGEAALVLFVIGETRSAGWLLQPGEAVAFELPAGAELFDGLGPLAHGATVPGGATDAAIAPFEDLFAPRVGRTALLVLPDGFLAAVPWSALPAPRASRHGDDDTSRLGRFAVMPTLQFAVDERTARTQQVRHETTFCAVLPDDAAAVPPVAAAPSLARFAQYDVLQVDNVEDTELRRHLSEGRSVLHVGLSLLAAGTGPGEIVFALPRGAGRAPRAITLEELVAEPADTDLVTIDAARGWATTSAARVRAAVGAIALGARTAITMAEPLDAGDGALLWRRFYARLADGLLKTQALDAARTDQERELPGARRPEVFIAGDAATRVIEPAPVLWPFWVTLGGIATVLAWVALSLVRGRRDPFQIEPPEEPVEFAPRRSA